MNKRCFEILRKNQQLKHVRFTVRQDPHEQQNLPILLDTWPPTGMPMGLAIQTIDICFKCRVQDAVYVTGIFFLSLLNDECWPHLRCLRISTDHAKWLNKGWENAVQNTKPLRLPRLIQELTFQSMELVNLRGNRDIVSLFTKSFDFAELSFFSLKECLGTERFLDGLMKQFQGRPLCLKHLAIYTTQISVDEEQLYASVHDITGASRRLSSLYLCRSKLEPPKEWGYMRNPFSFTSGLRSLSLYDPQLTNTDNYRANRPHGSSLMELENLGLLCSAFPGLQHLGIRIAPISWPLSDDALQSICSNLVGQEIHRHRASAKFANKRANCGPGIPKIPIRSSGIASAANWTNYKQVRGGG